MAADVRESEADGDQSTSGLRSRFTTTGALVRTGFLLKGSIRASIRAIGFSIGAFNHFLH